jgi:hypothetical protein
LSQLSAKTTLATFPPKIRFEDASQSRNSIERSAERTGYVRAIAAGLRARICRKRGATSVSSKAGSALATFSLTRGSPKRSMTSPAPTMRSTHPLKVR